MLPKYSLTGIQCHALHKVLAHEEQLCNSCDEAWLEIDYESNYNIIVQ